MKFSLGKFFKKANMNLQKFGRTLLLPIGIIAPVGMVLGITNALTQGYLIDYLPFLGDPILNSVFTALNKISLIIFDNMPLLFAMGVAYGLSKHEKGISIFGAVIGYLVFNVTMNQYLIFSDTLADPEVMSQYSQTVVLGIQTVRVDALGGMLIGVVSAFWTDKYYNKRLPTAFAFFGGKKLPPMITILTSIILGVLFPPIWGSITAVLTNFSSIFALGFVGTTLYFIGNRLLIPFGLHHVFSSLIRYTELGGTYDICGNTEVGVINALNPAMFDPACMGTVPMDQIGELTRFLAQGQMLVTLFAMPAIALAMYSMAKKENKAETAGLLSAVVAAAFFGNITEPLEFTFMFISPFLYIFHSLIIGVGAGILYLLGTSVGYIRGTIFDFAIFGVLTPGSGWFNIILVGIPLTITDFVVFRWAIKKWNLATPGREKVNTVKFDDFEPKELGDMIIKGLGGLENIKHVENCVTRLRVDIVDKTKINNEILNSTGAAGVFLPSSTHIHVVYGPQVEHVRNIVDKVMKGQL